MTATRGMGSLIEPTLITLPVLEPIIVAKGFLLATSKALPETHT